MLSVSSLGGRGCLHRFHETDHDELCGNDGGDSDFTKQHAAVDLIGRIGLGIAFYEKRLFGIPSYQYLFFVEISQERAGPLTHQIPGLMVVRLECDPGESGLELSA